MMRDHTVPNALDQLCGVVCVEISTRLSIWVNSFKKLDQRNLLKISFGILAFFFWIDVKLFMILMIIINFHKMSIAANYFCFNSPPVKQSVHFYAATAFLCE